MMAPVSRSLVFFLGLTVGVGLMLGASDGQDWPAGGKGKKEKKAKDEDKAVLKMAEKALKGSESERDKWLKELPKAFPGPVSPGLSEADFAQWFGLLSGGGAEWRRGNAPIKQVGELFDRVADRLGFEQPAAIRRDEFLWYARRFLVPGDSPPWKVHDPRAEAWKLFRSLDRDGSGFLEPDEWGDRLRAAAPRVDTNRDGRIDPEEYSAYLTGRVAWVIENGPDAPPPPTPQEPVEERRVAVRFGKLPVGLPAWFEELDADRDGQISLYEWRTSGRTIAEFAEYDLNGDGLLPPDEFLHYLRFFRPEPAPR